MHYLDCGCAISDDGERAWCPTCVDGGPKLSPLHAAAPDLLATLERLAWHLNPDAKGLCLTRAEMFVEACEAIAKAGGVTP